MRFIPIITVLLTPMLAFGGKRPSWKDFPDKNAQEVFKKMLTQPSGGKKVTLDRIETAISFAT